MARKHRPQHRISKTSKKKIHNSRHVHKVERFTGSRLNDQNERDSREVNEVKQSLHTGPAAGDSSDEADELNNQISNSELKPYHSLLQSFDTYTQPHANFRKEHQRPIAGSPHVQKSQEEGFIQQNSSHDSPYDGSNETKKEGEHESKQLSESKLSEVVDPFNDHFARPLEQFLKQHIQCLKSHSIETIQIDIKHEWLSKLTQSKDLSVPHVKGHRDPNALTTLNFGVKQRLQSIAGAILASLQGAELHLAEVMFTYRDILLSERTHNDVTRLRQLASLHALNHVLRTRERVLKNNELATEGATVDDTQFCDQGFTRPKVLFLLPTRRSCYYMVNQIISSYQPEQQEHKSRFENEFGGDGEPISKSKPDDFHQLFHGNDDDMFRVGLKFTRKTTKLFTQFYDSDMIFASPLGLRMAIGDQNSKKVDFDFLSSIELIFVDQAEALLMQNWEHVDYILDHLNLQPREAHGCDFSRVRPWYLDGNAQYVRQTVVFSQYNTPEVNNIFNSRMLNYAGKVKIAKKIHAGLISAPIARFMQTFYRFDAREPATEPDARFAYFSARIVPQIIKQTRINPGRSQGTLIFIPSYMDFVRIRNYFASSTDTRDVSFGSISEYTEAPDIARARSHFLKGRHGVILYTGRLHHFRRYQLKGAKLVIFYGLPDNPMFYKEIASDYPALGVIAGKVSASDISVKVLFSRFDALRLERIVGTERLRTMLAGAKGDVFEFIP